MKLEPIYMIPRRKNNPRNGDAMACRIQKAQDAKVIKQGVGIQGATITAKYYIALLDKLKQHLVFKYESKPSKGIFLQDIAASHKMANMHQMGRSLL
jgi:hypothetical protein